MKEKKIIFHYSITAINTIIAVCALYLAFSHNKQVTDVDFSWESSVVESIPVELKNQDSSDNLLDIPYSLSVWLRLKIVNTGFRTFTIDDISVWLSPLESESSPKFFRLVGNLIKPQSNGKLTNEEIELPMVIKPGHSKYFLQRIQIPISKNVYFTYKEKLKNWKSEISFLESKDCSIFQKYDISSEVTLAGGQIKKAHPQLCYN
jgi:hypothetical protein